MATSRFIKDSGLTARMTLTMFLLGALFVGLVVGLIYAVGSAYAPLVAVIAIGMAFWQWWSSDKVAMRAMRAREVSPEEAPELHGMIDRLCALADMPKPRVGVADTPVPNAFATGRSPERSVPRTGSRSRPGSTTAAIANGWRHCPACRPSACCPKPIASPLLARRIAPPNSTG